MGLDTRLKLIIVAVIIGSFIVAYLFFSQRAPKTEQQVIENPPAVTINPSPSPQSSQLPQVTGQNPAYTQLPSTAFPTSLLGLLAVCFGISGFFLRKFPE